VTCPSLFAAPVTAFGWQVTRGPPGSTYPLAQAGKAIFIPGASDAPTVLPRCFSKIGIQVEIEVESFNLPFLR